MTTNAASAEDNERSIGRWQRTQLQVSAIVSHLYRLGTQCHGHINLRLPLERSVVPLVETPRLVNGKMYAVALEEERRGVSEGE
jgi:hypothetical protein